MLGVFTVRAVKRSHECSQLKTYLEAACQYEIDLYFNHIIGSHIAPCHCSYRPVSVGGGRFSLMRLA